MCFIITLKSSFRSLSSGGLSRAIPFGTLMGEWLLVSNIIDCNTATHRLSIQLLGMSRNDTSRPVAEEERCCWCPGGINKEGAPECDIMCSTDRCPQSAQVRPITRSAVLSLTVQPAWLIVLWELSLKQRQLRVTACRTRRSAGGRTTYSCDEPRFLWSQALSAWTSNPGWHGRCDLLGASEQWIYSHWRRAVWNLHVPMLRSVKQYLCSRPPCK